MSTVNRSVSESLATKCLTVAATPPRWSPADQRPAHRRGQHRIFAEELEVTAAERAALQVDGGREEHVDALAAAFGGEEAAHQLGAARIPGRGQRDGSGHVQRGVPFVPAWSADTGRPV